MRYLKFIAIVVATGLSAMVGALVTPGVTPQEWINVALLTAGAASVVIAPNVPGVGAAYTKAILAVITAVLTLAVNLIAGGLDLSEWLQLAMAALGALGVYALPNEPGPVPPPVVQ